MTSAGITFLVLNDFHSTHQPFEFLPTEGAKLTVGGSVRIAQCIDNERRLAEVNGGKVVCLDAGDIFLGSDYFTFFSGEVEMTLYKLLGFEAMAVGNHEFDQGGLDNLIKKHKENATEMDLLCANIVHPGAKDQVFKPYRVLQVNGFKVGIVGLMGINSWDKTPASGKQGLIYKDMYETAQVVVKEIVSKHNSLDLLICLSHTGINRGDMELAKMGIFDVIFSGHEHFDDRITEWTKIKTNNPEREFTWIHPGNSNGKAISKMHLYYTDSGELRLEPSTIVINSTFDAVDSGECNLASSVAKLLDGYRNEIKHITSEKIAVCKSQSYSKEFIGTNFALDCLSPLSALILEALLLGYESDINNEKVKIHPNELLAVINFGGIRGAFSEGDVTVGNVCQVYPFNATSEIIKVKGIHLKRLHAKNKQLAQRRKKNKAPGLGLAVRWLGNRGEIEADEYDKIFYLMLSNYLRENHVSDLMSEDDYQHPLLDDLVVWKITEATYTGEFKPAGVRDCLIKLLRQKKQLPSA